MKYTKLIIHPHDAALIIRSISNQELNTLIPKSVLLDSIYLDSSPITLKDPNLSFFESKLNQELTLKNSNEVYKLIEVINDHYVLLEDKTGTRFIELLSNCVFEKEILEKVEKGTLSYEAHNLHWQALMTLNLNLDVVSGVILANIDNKSGLDYEDVTLQLTNMSGGKTMPRVMMAREADMQTSQEPSFESYEFDGLFTLKNNTLTQVELASFEDVKCTKIYRYDGHRANLELSFANPLEKQFPESETRLFENGTYMGSSRSQLTQDNRILLNVSVTKLMGNIKTLQTKETQKSVLRDKQITLYNHFDTDVDVMVSIYVSEKSEISESTHAYKRPEANLLEFTVYIGSKDKVVIEYKEKEVKYGNY